jgi:hypothetical protein
MLLRAGWEVEQVKKSSGQRIGLEPLGLLMCLVWCLSASRAQFRQRVAEGGALGDWASHLGLNSRVRSSECPIIGCQL